MDCIDSRIKKNMMNILSLIEIDKSVSIAMQLSWDNRPTWDNWPNKPGHVWDNRPTWDNWANKN